MWSNRLRRRPPKAETTGSSPVIHNMLTTKIIIEGREAELYWTPQLASWQELEADSIGAMLLSSYRRKLADTDLIEKSVLIKVAPLGGIIMAVPTGGCRRSGQLDWATNCTHLVAIAQLLRGREGFERLRIETLLSSPFSSSKESGTRCNLNWGDRISGDMGHETLGILFGYRPDVIREHIDGLRR